MKLQIIIGKVTADTLFQRETKNIFLSEDDSDGDGYLEILDEQHSILSASLNLATKDVDAIIDVLKRFKDRYSRGNKTGEDEGG
jgi:hypothetical protein